MKKLLLVLALVIGFSNSAFALWTCTKPANANAIVLNTDGSATVSVSCTDGTDTVSISRPVRVPQDFTNAQVVAYLKNQMRTWAQEASARKIVTNKLQNLKTNIDGVSYTAAENAPDA